MTAAASIRRLTRYKLMFRASTMAFGAAVLIIVLGLLTAIFVADGSVLASGLLLAAVSGLLAYKVTVSTMALIDGEPNVGSWQGLDQR